VSLTELTPELREFFGAPKDAGVLVSSVSENGPAAKAGMRVGDVITAVNGKPTAGYRDLREAIKDNHAGDNVRLEIIRGKGRQTIVATAEEREGPEIRAFKLGEIEKGLFPKSEWRGMLMAPENDELRTRIRDLEKRLQELEKRLQQK
jgi:C-terminal processing protease CtpA/Prc